MSRINCCEIYLRDALAKLLNIEPNEISSTTAFDELGIDSLTGLRLTRELQDSLKMEIELEWIYDYPTIGQFSRFIQQRIENK